jgi:hypothetical protein
MHRGIYSYDPGVSSTDALSGVARGTDKKRQHELAAKVVPQWVIAAPRAAAKAYVERLNGMLRVAASDKTHLSAAALLFDVSPVELQVSIPTSLNGLTVQQLQFPKGSVSTVGRIVDGKRKPLENPQQKLDGGDVLVLKGTPHAIATVATVQAGRVVILKPKESAAMRAHLKDEKESLMLAAQELHDRLLPGIRRMQWGTRPLALLN